MSSGAASGKPRWLACSSSCRLCGQMVAQRRGYDSVADRGQLIVTITYNSGRKCDSRSM